MARNGRITNLLLQLGIVSTTMLCTGCSLLGIPSHRLDNACQEDHCSSMASGNCSPLPSELPMPACLAKWRDEKKLPKAPSFPRFHPLPTRPIFDTRETDLPAQLAPGQEFAP